MLNLVERRVQAETVHVEVSGWVARALDSFGGMPEAEPLRVARSDVVPANLIMVKRTEHGVVCPVASQDLWVAPSGVWALDRSLASNTLLEG